MTKNKPYLLAIESAIAGGSIALFKGVEFVDGMSGLQAVSRAEDLLPNLRDLLDRSTISKGDLGRVAVSIGPGSYTGLRIGIASVMGLARGLNIEIVGVPIFEALAASFPDIAAFALPMGKTDICFALASRKDQPSVAAALELSRTPEFAHAASIGAYSDLIPSLDEFGDLNLIDIGNNLARFVGNVALNRPASRNLEPIYVQNPRFG